MALRSCDFDGCEQPAVQRAGDCLLCDKHLCRTHLQDEWHKCPKPDENWTEYCKLYSAAEARQLKDLSRSINGLMLCNRASKLRGVGCIVDLSTEALSSMMGGQNCHAIIRFTDDVQWIARFRLVKTTSPPVEVRDYILRSEVATMSFLQARTQVPSPKVHDWACESDPNNLIGPGYILMEKLDGKPLDWQKATRAQKDKVMQQLADIFIELERYPLAAAGSLDAPTPDPSAYEIGALAHYASFRPEPAGGLGPFSSSKEAGCAIVCLYLTMVANGEIGADYPVDLFLAHCFRLEVVAGLCGEPSPDERFFLKHPDDKGDHILVNDNYDIVGIIDWEWCQAVSKEYAFSSPCMMWPVAKFYEGSNELSDDETHFAAIFELKRRGDLADCVKYGRRVQRFFFALGPSAGALDDHETFVSLFKGLKTAFDDENEGWEGWEEWKANALQRWKDNPALKKLLQQGA